MREALHAHAAALRVHPDWPVAPRGEIDFPRPERGADILQHDERPSAAFIRSNRRQTDQPLVARLVIPVRQKHCHEPQRVYLVRSCATAGRVVVTAEVTPSIERLRLGELSFITDAYIDEARTLAGDLKRRFDPGETSFATLRSDGGIAYRAGSYDRAANLFGRAVTLSPEDVAAWLDFTVANNARSPQNW